MIINTFSSAPANPSPGINAEPTSTVANQAGNFVALMLFALALPQNSTGTVNGAQTTTDNAQLALLGESETPLQAGAGQVDTPNDAELTLDQPPKDSSSLNYDDPAVFLIASALVPTANDIQLDPSASADTTESPEEAKSAAAIPEKNITSVLPPSTVPTMPTGLLDNQAVFNASTGADVIATGTEPIKNAAALKPTGVDVQPDEKVTAPVSGEANKPVSLPQQTLDTPPAQVEPVFTPVISDEKASVIAAPPPTGSSLAQPIIASTEALDGQPVPQPAPAVQDSQKTQATDNGAAGARSREFQPQTNLGPVISTIARERTNETFPGLKLGQQNHAPNDRGEETSVEPAQAATKSNLSALVNDRQKSASDRGDAWPHNSETKNPNAGDQPFSTMLTADPTAPRQEPRSYADLSSSGWRPTVERLAGDMVRHLRIGLRDAVIQLDPPELGSIKIDLRMEGDKLQARIVTEAHEAQSLIENHLTELRQALQTRGIEVGDVRVSHGAWSGTAGDFTQSFQQTPQGRQESAWRFENSAGAARDKSGIVTAQAAPPDHSRVSIRV